MNNWWSLFGPLCEICSVCMAAAACIALIVLNALASTPQYEHWAHTLIWVQLPLWILVAATFAYHHAKIGFALCVAMAIASIVVASNGDGDSVFTVVSAVAWFFTAVASGCTLALAELGK